MCCGARLDRLQSEIPMGAVVSSLAPLTIFFIGGGRIRSNIDDARLIVRNGLWLKVLLVLPTMIMESRLMTGAGVVGQGVLVSQALEFIVVCNAFSWLSGNSSLQKPSTSDVTDTTLQ